MKRLVFMFPGQGSQYYCMAEDLYRRQPIFKKWVDNLDEIVRQRLGVSIISHLVDKRHKAGDPFDRLLYTHPAIFMVEYALSRIFEENDVKPDWVLGASLGEFVSAAICGVMPVREALELVMDQAEIFENQGPAGGMLAIFDSPSLFEESPVLKELTELASVDYARHFVVAGKIGALKEVEVFLAEKGITYQRLPVKYPFHSSLIDPVAPVFSRCLERMKFHHPDRPFLSGTFGKSPGVLPRDYFWQIVRLPMRFPTIFSEIETGGDCIYLDLGPSGTMANFVKNNLEPGAGSLFFPLMSPFGRDSERVEKALAFLKKDRFIPLKKEEKKMKVFMFPGQGSQKKGMGEALLNEFKDLVQKADEILGYSIKELCLEDPGGKLVQTQYTQPAVYVVNALGYLKKIQTEPKPDYVLGHSVAEYDALFASGAVDFETGLKLVNKRGELMAGAKGGGMAAVMGLDGDKVVEVLKNSRLENLYVANFNSTYQIVISGLKEEIEKAEPFFKEAGASHYRILNVGGAFHTPYMAEAKAEFGRFVEGIKFGETTIPVISNVTARPYKRGRIKEYIVEQITSPVKWMESIRYLLAKGIDIGDFHEISGVEISVVKGLAMRINHEAGPLDLTGEKEETGEMANEEKTAPVVGQSEIKEEKTKKEIKDEKQAVKPKVSLREKIGEKLKRDKKVKDSPGKSPLQSMSIRAESLGSKEFKADYRLVYAYLTGGMYKGIASKEMVVKVGKAGMMGFFGAGGLELSEIETAIRYIQQELKNGEPYGVNLVYNPIDSTQEERTIDLLLKYGVRTIEAAAYMMVSPSLVFYRAKGLKQDPDGGISSQNRIIAKLSRPEVAEQFLSPAPERVVQKLLATGKIDAREAGWLSKVPVADDLCVEADSGGHTDQGMPYALMPAMLRLRDEMMKKYGYPKCVRVGAAGGIGTPEAASAAFILGADFILTGSINQCTVEAGTSQAVKELLQEINVQDTDYAPAGDMFELGAKVQVLKRGVFFPARANKLYDLYRHYNSLDEIDEKTREQLQERYFKKSFADIYRDVKAFYPPEEIERAERNPKHKMALIFRWYFGYSTRLALEGDTQDKVNYQVHCGPALGAFNQWVKGTALENWHNRHVDEIGKKIMTETAEWLNRRFRGFGS